MHFFHRWVWLEQGMAHECQGAGPLAHVRFYDSLAVLPVTHCSKCMHLALATAAPPTCCFMQRLPSCACVQAWSGLWLCERPGRGGCLPP